MIAKNYKRVRVSLGMLMDYARLGFSPRVDLPDVNICVAPSMHIPNEQYIAAGADAIDRHKSDAGTLGYDNLGACTPPDVCFDWMNSRGVNWDTISDAQLEELAQHIFSAMKGRFGTHQMQETVGRDPMKCINYANPKSNWVEKRVAGLMDGSGYYYFSGYDSSGSGYVLENVSMRGQRSLLSTAAGCLQIMRENSGFGNPGFLPHSIHGEPDSQGAAEYRHVQIQAYGQWSMRPSLFVYGTVFAGHVARKALQGLADLTSDPAKKAKILSRQINNFTWSAIWEQFANQDNRHTTKVPGLSGYQITYMLNNAPVSVQYGMLLAWLIEHKWVFDWEDRRVYGTDPGTLQGYRADMRIAGYGQTASRKDGYFNEEPQPAEAELPAGYFGPETVRLASSTSGQYIAGYVAAYPQRPMGSKDLLYVCKHTLADIRGWVGIDTPWEYAPIQAGGDTALCDTNPDTYLLDRYTATNTQALGNMGRMIGWRWYNPVTKRGAFAGMNYAIARWQREAVSTQIGGQTVNLTLADGSQLNGGYPHVILFDFN